MKKRNKLSRQLQLKKNVPAYLNNQTKSKGPGDKNQGHFKLFPPLLVHFPRPFKTVVLIGFMAFVLLLPTGCWHQSKRVGMDLQPTYGQIQDVISIAECDSPFGKYFTEVRSFKNGTCYFHQSFGDTIPPFIVELNKTNKGMVVDSSGKVLDTLSIKDVAMIRGHEIHKMSIDPSFFFTDIAFKRVHPAFAGAFDLFSAKDNIGHAVELLYDRSQKKITKITMLNPKDTTQTIEVAYISWVSTPYGDLVKESKIIQAGKDTFDFNFIQLRANNGEGFRELLDP